MLALVLVLAVPPADAAVCDIHNSDFGDVNNSWFNNGNDYSGHAYKYIPSQTCTVTAIGVDAYIDATHANGSAIIYADSSGAPGSVLETGGAFSPSLPVGVSLAWATSTMAGTTVLTAGVTYWVGITSTNSGSAVTREYWELTNDTGNMLNFFNSAWTTTGATATQKPRIEIDGTISSGGGVASFWNQILIRFGWGF